MIYFIQQGTDGPIKIGYTNSSVESRLANLQTANCEKLHLLATATGEQRDEAMLHARFADERLNGEWFKPSTRLIEYLFPCPTPFLNSFHPVYSQIPVSLDDKIDELEKTYLKSALIESNGSKIKAAKLLNISFRSFRYRLEKHGIN